MVVVRRVLSHTPEGCVGGREERGGGGDDSKWRETSLETFSTSTFVTVVNKMSKVKKSKRERKKWDENKL